MRYVISMQIKSFFRIESVVEQMKLTFYQGFNHGEDVRLDHKLYNSSSSDDEDQNDDQKLESKQKMRRRTYTLDNQLRQGMFEMRDQLDRAQYKNSNAFRHLGRRMSKIEDLVKQLKKKKYKE